MAKKIGQQVLEARQMLEASLDDVRANIEEVLSEFYETTGIEIQVLIIKSLPPVEEGGNKIFSVRISAYDVEAGL